MDAWRLGALAAAAQRGDAQSAGFVYFIFISFHFNFTTTETINRSVDSDK